MSFDLRAVGKFVVDVNSTRNAIIPGSYQFFFFAIATYGVRCSPISVNHVIL